MFVSLFSRSTGICDDLEFLPDEELSNVQFCALHMEMTNTEQLLGSIGLGPVTERRDKQYQLYQFIHGIAIYYHLAPYIYPRFFPEERYSFFQEQKLFRG